jgi:hypothetical protein
MMQGCAVHPSVRLSVTAAPFLMLDLCQEAGSSSLNNTAERRTPPVISTARAQWLVGWLVGWFVCWFVNSSCY